MSLSTVLFGSKREAGRRAATWDGGMLTGLTIACAALAAGIALTGVSARYFLQPTSILIVVGGSAGAMLATTPRAALTMAIRRAACLFSPGETPNREELAEEIVAYARLIRMEGILAIEPAIDGVSQGFLKEALLLALDAKDHAELESALENKVRFAERQNEAAAKVFELAGGVTPTIGVLGTVVGLIDVLRQFSNLPAVAYGVGAAFTSTFYGLALANLVLLPVAHRIRARAAETFDLQAMMAEGALCAFDGIHPRLVRQRLRSFLTTAPVDEAA